MADAAAQCAYIGDISLLEPPGPAYVMRVDAGLSIGLCLVYVVILLRFLTWIHRLMRQSEDTLRNVVLCTVFTAVGVYILLGLPSLWLRNAILSRNKSTMESGLRYCAKHTRTCAEGCAKLTATLAANFKAKPADTALRILVYVIVGLLILLAVIVALHGKSMAATVEEGEEICVRRAKKNKNRRYDITTVKKTADDDDDETCVVCLSELWTRKACQLQCEHRFHVSCINHWLSKAYRPICPLCLVEVRVKPPKSQAPPDEEPLDQVVVDDGNHHNVTLQIPHTVSR